MPYTAYTKTQNVTQSPRDVEYRLLGAATSALIEAEESGILVKRVDAVCWNRDIWAAFRRDLTHPQNTLPPKLKDELVDLSKWVDRETFRILSGDTIELDGLIGVNKNIMAGLKPPGAPSNSAEITQE